MFCDRCFKIKQVLYSHRGARKGEGGSFNPPETEKIVVEKWCYFQVLYKMTKVLEDGIENG